MGLYHHVAERVDDDLLASPFVDLSETQKSVSLASWWTMQQRRLTPQHRCRHILTLNFPT
jgi:hypothetical protein